MLGKLIKYDMKALNRFLIVLHGFLLFASVLGRVFITNNLELSSTQAINQNSTALVLTSVVFLFLIMGVSFGTLIVVAVRFYKNIYSDEGYLTRTLPVTSGAHLLSKTITGSVWCIIDSVLLFVSMYIVVATPSVMAAFNENKADIMKELGITGGFSITSSAAILTVTLIVGCISGVLTLYVSIALGQLFSGHRVLGAVVCYFAFTTVISVLSTLVLAVKGFFKQYGPNGYFGDTVGTFNFSDYMLETLKLSVGLAFVSGIICYIITYCLMKKKTNLV